MQETGWYSVTVPRDEDAVGGALRNAFAEGSEPTPGDLPEDMAAMLQQLNKVGEGRDGR